MYAQVVLRIYFMSMNMSTLPSWCMFVHMQAADGVRGMPPLHKCLGVLASSG